MGPLEIVACGTMLLPVLAVVGAGVGVVAGLMVGLTLGVAAAPLTLGFSMVLSPMSWIWLGAALGAFGACTCGARLCVLWVENALLYHPRPYYDGDPEEGVLYLGGEPYELEWVCCPLPVPRGPGGQPGGASPAPELHRSLLLRPQKWGASVMWVVFGGNAMLASDWYPFCNQLCRLQGRRGGASAAFLLFDFPGYGGNPGRTSPAATLTASLCSLRAALARFDAGPPEVNLLGHSLGAAAAAQLAAHLAITGAPAGRLVLSAPFTSIPHVAVHLLQRAAGFVWQRAAPPRLRRPCSATARTDLSRRLGRPPAGFWSRGLPRSRPTAGATSRPCVRPPARAGRWASSTARRTCWCRPAWAASFTTRRARPPSTLPPVGGSAAPRGSCCSMGGPPQRRRLRRRVRSVASWRCPERTTATRCCSAPPVVQSSWASCEVAGGALVDPGPSTKLQSFRFSQASYTAALAAKAPLLVVF
ncbi:unnamed protein product [Prorocentrum cordatum]|uniref:AB hydrolase-1 domain-containing protein n=1 Tax=Prorocentrum cordatum TaxID=2364126 RepID=A0ABN9QRI8_9DINO|nr:unnamed protein product [Polarella glacialis]